MLLIRPSTWMQFGIHFFFPFLKSALGYWLNFDLRQWAPLQRCRLERWSGWTGGGPRNGGDLARNGDVAVKCDTRTLLKKRRALFWCVCCLDCDDWSGRLTRFKSSGIWDFPAQIRRQREESLSLLIFSVVPKSTMIYCPHLNVGLFRFGDFSQFNQK